jgi:hypothetical protein
MFRKAVKRDAKLRLALSGPAGSGKTYEGWPTEGAHAD